MIASKSILLRTTAIAGLAALAMALPTAAFAQDATAPAQTSDDAEPSTAFDPAAEAQETGEAEIVVTGTRLDAQFGSSNPVVAVSSAAIENAGTTSIAEFLREVPALSNSFDLQAGANIANFGRVGASRLNLRNLGPERTLVLVNGRRHVAANRESSAVDVNTIPVGLIDRVDVLTGGASAVYGADGVSGVVNFILKRDFEGLDVRAQSGVSDGGGGENLFGSVLFGRNFAGGRGNFTLSGEVSTTKRIFRDQRGYTALGRRLTEIGNPIEAATGVDDPNLPDRIFARDARYIDSSAAGAVYVTFTGNNPGAVDFDGDGSPWIGGDYDGNFTQVGGSGTLRESYVRDLSPSIDRYALNGTFRFDIADGHNFFAEGKYVRTETEFESQPIYDFITVPVANPFIPANIRAAAVAAGASVIFSSRDEFELGFATADITRDTYRGVIGFEGQLGDNIRYEASYVYGRTEEINRRHNDRIEERFLAAVDAVRDPVTGSIVCRSNLNPTANPPGTSRSRFGLTFTPGANSGCVPANIFGAGQVSPAARDWFMITTVDNSLIQQHVLNGYISGDSEGWLALPGGPVSFVVGGEYRKEKSDFVPDPLRQRTADILTDPAVPSSFRITNSGSARRTRGQFGVKEVFAEISLPLLRDLPLVEALTVNAAYRYSDYSTSGGTSTWNVGGQWRINNSVMLRGTRARAVRAPNIAELFTPQTLTRASLVDPCTSRNVRLGRDPATRLTNCTASLAPLGLNPETYVDTGSFTILGLTGGNPNLRPEKGDTWTVGGVLTPTFIPGLAISLDYYDIKLRDAINAFSAQTVVNNCFDLPQPNPFCQNLTRNTGAENPTARGRLASFQTFRQNVAAFETSGFDLTARYNLDPARMGISDDIGRFQFAVTANKLEKLRFFEVEGQTPDSNLGEEGAPEWQASFDVTWLKDNFTLNYGFTWADNTIRYPNTYDVEPDFIEDKYKFYSERFTHDIQARIQAGNMDFYVGVNNFTNQEPDPGSVTAPVGVLGRFFYAGANIKLGGPARR
jgi:outer membrane receptor protein involved in Fe transport